MRDRIREVRKMKNITQAKLVQNISLTRQYISLIELGKETPSLKIANEIANELGVCMGVYMNKILGIVFLLATILMGMISNGKIKLDNNWVILIFILQITSWIGYINLLDIEKRYKLWLSVLSVCAVFIIGFFYILNFYILKQQQN